MNIAVIANGEWDANWGKTELSQKQYELLIAADGGADYALAAGQVPDVLIGDLDSVSSDSLAECRHGYTLIKKYPKEKDETDLELALDYAHSYLEKNGTSSDEIWLYAATGKRLDHLLGNIGLMSGYAAKKRRIRMVCKDYQAWVLTQGKERIAGNKGQVLSLIPLTEKARISSKGLYYELADLTLLASSARGISNVFLGQEAEIEVHEGRALLVLLTES